MSKRQKHQEGIGGNGAPFVSEKFCNERSKNMLDKVETGFKTLGDKIDELKADKKESGHFWRNFAGTVVGGIIVGVVVYVMQHL